MGISKDAIGFTNITPTAGWQNGFNSSAPGTSTTMIIFVSNLTGLDTTASNEGSFARPYKTLAKALTRTGGLAANGNTTPVRAGSPDWILLATGETWTGEPTTSRLGPGLDSLNPMVLSSYDKTATVSTPSNPPVPNPTTGVVARPILVNSPIYFSQDNTVILGLDLYAASRDTVANPANAGNPDPGNGIFMQHVFTNVLIEDNIVRWFFDGINLDSNEAVNTAFSGPLSVRRNVVYNNWGDKFGIGSDSIRPNFLLEENLVDHNGWDAVGQPDGSSLNHNYYISGTNGVSSGAIQLSDLYMHGNISIADLFQSQNRCGGHLNNNLWQLGGDNGTNYGPNNPSIASLVENEVYIGGFLGGIGHVATASDALNIQAQLNDGGGFHGNGVPGIQHIYINKCIVTQGVGTQNGLTTVGNGDGAWTNLVTVTGCISYKFSGTTVYTAIETVINGGGNLGTNSPSQAVINGWPHPERTPETYMAEVMHDGSTWADFSRRCRLQSRRNWNRMLMAESVNDYIRQGFNMPMIGSAYADTQGTPPVLMAQICM